MSLNNKQDWERAEIEALSLLKQKGYTIIKPDCVVVIDGKAYFLEAKWQEPFEPPPFRGQGLPPKQAEHYMQLLQMTGTRTIFMVKDKPNGYWRWQFLDVLEADESHTTNGERCRKVYPIEKFLLF